MEKFAGGAKSTAPPGRHIVSRANFPAVGKKPRMPWGPHKLAG
jgi:hypothetical protein